MKKSWKRWMALAITGMLGIGALTGCTGGQAETGQTQEASEKSVDNQEEQQALMWKRSQLSTATIL